MRVKEHSRHEEYLPENGGPLMPLSLILALIVAALGALCVVFVPLAIDRPTDGYGRPRVEERLPNQIAADRRRLRLAIALGFAVPVVLLLFSASATIVPARNVGVEVSLGKPVGQLDNGFHMVAPWHRVEKFDAGIQTLEMQGDGDGKDAPCVTVRLGNQTTACIDVIRSQWNIDPNGDVIELYRRYRKFDKIELNVVAGQEMNALVSTFADFDPLAGITGAADAPMRTTDDLAKQALAKTQASVGTGIHVDNLLLRVNYDPTTQGKLNDYAKALAETRIATQNRATAEQKALANKALAAQASVRDPGVQYQNCLNLIADLAAKGQLKDLPATFNCGDPRSGVIVGARGQS